MHQLVVMISNESKYHQLQVLFKVEYQLLMKLEKGFDFTIILRMQQYNLKGQENIIIWHV